MEQSVEDVLAAAAAAVEAGGKQKKERKPKEEKAPREPKVAKEKTYVQWNEDGTPLLDEEGNRIRLTTKMDHPKSATVAREGGPRNSFLDDTILTVTDKVATFREGTSRHAHYVAISDGMTAGAFFAATGGRGVTGTYLAWYIGQGYVSITASAE